MVFFLCFSLNSTVYGAKFVNLENVPVINNFVNMWKNYKNFPCEVNDTFFRLVRDEEDDLIYTEEEWVDSFDENNNPNPRPDNLILFRKLTFKLPVFKPKEKIFYFYGASSLNFRHLPISVDEQGHARIKDPSGNIKDFVEMGCDSKIRQGELLIFGITSKRNPRNGYMFVYDALPLVSNFGDYSLQAWLLPHLNHGLYLVKAKGFKPNELVEFSLGKISFFASKKVVRSNQNGTALALVFMHSYNEKVSLNCANMSLLLKGIGSENNPPLKQEEGKFQQAFID